MTATCHRGETMYFPSSTFSKIYKTEYLLHNCWYNRKCHTLVFTIFVPIMTKFSQNHGYRCFTQWSWGFGWIVFVSLTVYTGFIRKTCSTLEGYTVYNNFRYLLPSITYLWKRQIAVNIIAYGLCFKLILYIIILITGHGMQSQQLQNLH